MPAPVLSFFIASGFFGYKERILIQLSSGSLQNEWETRSVEQDSETDQEPEYQRSLGYLITTLPLVERNLIKLFPSLFDTHLYIQSLTRTI